MKTKSEVEKYMRCNGMSGVVTERVKKLMNEFATPDSFFNAGRSDIEKAYKNITPDGHHGIGSKFWDVFDKVRRFWKEKDEPQAKEEKNEGNVVQPKVDTRLVRLIPYKELKAVVDMMDLLDIEAVNLLEIVGFLESVRFRQRKPEEKSEQPKAEGDGNGSEK